MIAARYVGNRCVPSRKIACLARRDAGPGESPYLAVRWVRVDHGGCPPGDVCVLKRDFDQHLAGRLGNTEKRAVDVEEITKRAVGRSRVGRVGRGWGPDGIARPNPAATV